MSGYCATCNNTGSIDCHCGGDLCVCGEEEIECPECGGGFADEDYDDDHDPPLKVVDVSDDLHRILGEALTAGERTRLTAPSVSEER